MREDYIYYSLAIHLNAMITKVEEESGVLYPLEKFLPNTDWHHDVGAFKFNTMVQYFVDRGLLEEGKIPVLNLDADWNYALTRHYILMFLDNLDLEMDLDEIVALLNGEGQYWGFSAPLQLKAGESFIVEFKTESELLDKYFLDGRAEGSGLYLVVNGSGGWDWSPEVESVSLDGEGLEKYSIFTENDNEFHTLKVTLNTDVNIPAVGVSQWNSNWFAGVIGKVLQEDVDGAKVYSNSLTKKQQGATQFPEIGTETLTMTEYVPQVWGFDHLDFGYKVETLEGRGGYGSSQIWVLTEGKTPSGNLATEGPRFIAQAGDKFLKFTLGTLLESTDIAEGKFPIAQMGLYKNDAAKTLVKAVEFRGTEVAEGYSWHTVEVEPFELEEGVEYFVGISVNGWTKWPEYNPESGVSTVYTSTETQVLENLEGLPARSSNWALPFYATVERKLSK